ncbi:MAG TPA: hypothetical protein PLW10_20400, partial [Myxococcota bacterium]|nr:hypothetical protein [Myxococcota bacterium]
NGALRTSAPVTTTVAAHPNPIVRVSASPTYNVFGALRAQAGTGVLEPVGVESARALDRDARAALAASVGLIPEAIEWRDAPELLAGLRVSTTRGLVDASAVGLAAHAERRLAGRVAAEAGTDG